MAQIFHPSTNTIAKVSIFGGVFILAGVAALIMVFVHSSYTTGVGVFVEQPVPFSHEHHVSGLGIDCRYCHTSVEKSSAAGIPPTETCMTCHSQIWTNAEVLEPVRASFRTDRPIEWIRVHNLPDFVYFNHSIHVAKGVGCETCHGRVDQMAFTYKANTLYMEWCLDCHRHPENYIRPVEEIYTMGYQPQEDQVTLGRELVKAYNIQVPQLTNCSVCHH
ncbi:MAG: cytochrome c [Chloroflexota bacterium]|nr:MAG: cytochrome c [Chloroflexota bacterium]